MNLGIVMDPIGSINIKKDSSFAMLLAAQQRGWQLRYMELSDLFLLDGSPHARMRSLRVMDDPATWYELGPGEDNVPLGSGVLDAVLMRKDPPFNMEYIYATYLLELIDRSRVLVVNDPRSLRDCNEKLFTAWFPQCCPPSLVTRSAQRIRDFHAMHADVILKPLDGMGGASVFRLQASELNRNVIIETLTAHGSRFVMAQRFIPEISAGDKRILLVDGIPVPYALARIPAPGENRGNLAAGGSSRGVPLSPRDHWICSQVGPALRDRGLLFVGLDVIGDYLTEINVTSPTYIRELDELFHLDIAGTLMNCIETRLGRNNGST